MDVLAQAIALSEAGDELALATVVEVGGSSPRHPGAKMLVRSDGCIFGTIGGGRIELEVTNAGREVAAGAPARWVRHHLVRDLAMCCGGRVAVYVEPVSASIDAIRRAVELWRRRQPVLLVTPLDGSGKLVDETDRRNARVFTSTAHEFVEPVQPPDRVVMFGCGHVARAIGPIVSRLGFDVVVCDDNETDELEREPEWANIIVPSFELSDVERAIGELGAGDYAVIVTRDHAVDQRILEQLFAREALGYLGLIGSRGKIGRFKKRLEAKGVATPERWARLHAPIGVDIGAETPAEIAVSIAAQLIGVRSSRPIGPDGASDAP
jgi:xanthine dehydrogenase accessory factor